LKKSFFKIFIATFVLFLTASCAVDSTEEIVKPSAVPVGTVSISISQTPPPVAVKEINYLALGDSYTIGQSVCETCRFPEQLKKSLGNVSTLKIIAQTGWTTTNLISAINNQNPSLHYDLVTLLIGVNNQYQNISFSVYEKDFPALVNKAIALGKGDKSNVIVVSIPDYAFTPFGKQSNPSKISAEIDNYNAFAQNYCKANTIEFITITDITRQGLINPLLVATDGLHPSEFAYSLFVECILPKARIAVQN
jgi:lysophospholipase L1-like esterase